MALLFCLRVGGIPDFPLAHFSIVREIVWDWPVLFRTYVDVEVSSFIVTVIKFKVTHGLFSGKIMDAPKNTPQIVTNWLS